jgi:hypothetical protein
MRKKTVPRTRKQNKASSSAKSKGLIANDRKSRQSAGTESILDNRSHRTPKGKLPAQPAPSHLTCDEQSPAPSLPHHRPVSFTARYATERENVSEMLVEYSHML